MSNTMFVYQPFTSHSGVPLAWKVDCDALTPEDWACIAKLVAGKVRYKEVIGVPRGGLALAEAMRPYADPDAEAVLIVDDVLTTGRSMEEARAKVEGEQVRGIVLFARTSQVPEWVTPVFRLDGAFAE